MDKYLQGLFVLANDPVAEVRKLVCAAFVHLTEVLPSSIEPHLRNVMEYMLQVNKDPDEEVALEACEFWSAYCDAQLPTENLKEFLPRLIPVLLSNMAYADDDESLLDAEEDESQPDRDQDLKPRFHTSRLHGSEDFDDDDDDSFNVWNLRKCSAAAIDVLSNVFGDEILPALMPLIQRRNLRIVYDAIGTLADSVREELNKPAYLEILMPPLVAKWQQLSNSDKDLFPLLECFTSISQALGVGFAPFAQPVFQRCMDIIQLQLLAKVDPASAGAQYDREFIVCSLDLLSGLAEGLGSGIESLISPSNLRDLLLKCCMDEASDVRQSAFALMGDLARVYPAYLQPRMVEFLEIASQQLSANLIRENLSVANNACWAIGELAVKVRQEVSPIVTNVASSLGLILQHGEAVNKSLVENSAITLGRLAWIRPDLVAPHMEHFMKPWCLALSTVRDDIEKEDAFRGLCAVVKVNPSGGVSSLVFICKAIASWHEIRSEDVNNEVSQVLNGYKQLLGNSWAECLSALEPPVKERLARYV
ncbi:hypothetical protein F2Q68_00033829 [Brassica cretica]|uniref:Importin subunit beta-1/Transportin-1-like TPR repeats domain-containing protein n=1 Tax=Brassica cretica TaxID=69181 RepID=A0A8S9H355_BRACR|nr:hypothetical protein F2Q68_00033829 [Brassica cretica]